MRITVLKVNVADVQGQKGPYKAAELAYKNEAGQVKSFKVLSFNRNVFDVVSKTNPNEVLEVNFQKDIKGFWQMTDAKATGEIATGVVTDTHSAGSTKGNWETTEERSRKQVYIVRQSSISNALAFLLHQKTGKPEIADVLKVADEFTQFVFNGLPKPSEVI